MTEPRRFIEGTTYFITRRCTQRQFWLKPTKRTTDVFLNCLAAAAQRTGVLVHGVCAMSKHYHLVVTDPDARVAEFYGWLNKYVSKAINASYGRWKNLWSSEKASVIPLGSRKDVLAKLVYVLCNPVQARLVAKGSNWPGAWLFRRCHSQTLTRPEVYFREDGTMPEKNALTVSTPPQFAHLTREAYEKMMDDHVFRREQKIAAKMEQKGQSFLGVRGVVRQHPKSCPASFEPRRTLNPRVAAKSKWQRIETIQRNKDFLVRYHEALKRWSDGDRDVEFPPGTYLLRVQFGVRCSPG